MFSTTAFGNLGHLISGRRLFRTSVEKDDMYITNMPMDHSYHSSIQFVEWCSENDPDNPKKWPFPYKCFVTFIVCVMTVFVYLGSSIVVPGIPEFSDKFNVSPTVSSLSISLFVWGYGLGPMVLSPITEIARIGRNWPYVISIGLFVILQVPTALCNNVPGYLILRFITGFLGSPVLATGGATMGDLWNIDGGFMNGIAFWSYAACGGPGMGALLSGFAVQERGLQWTIWPLLCGTGLTWIIVFFLMPETSGNAILTKRARTLRRITGDDRIRSHAEIQDASLSFYQLTYTTLCRPLKMTFTEPVLFFSNVYIAYVYGIAFCLYVESVNTVLIQALKLFPLYVGQIARANLQTFQDRHQFTLGQSSSAYVTGWVVCAIALILYCAYNQKVVLPWFKSGKWKPEYRIQACFVGGILFPISLFWVCYQRGTYG